MKTRIHRSHVGMLLGKLRRGHLLNVQLREIERQLGYPLSEADPMELRGIIAALEAVNAAPLGGDR